MNSERGTASVERERTIGESSNNLALGEIAELWRIGMTIEESAAGWRWLIEPNQMGIVLARPDGALSDPNDVFLILTMLGIRAKN